jgi:hypothetical protein
VDPAKTGALRGGLVGITLDAARDQIYGAMTPTGDLYVLDINTLRSRKIGRPNYQRDFVYPGRVLWVDRRGRVYFTAGNGASYDPAVFGFVRYWDPVSGFGELRNWPLKMTRAIDAVQCFADGTCFLTDDMGQLYKFVDPATGTPRWTFLGSVDFSADGSARRNWVFQVSRNKKFAYLLTRHGRFFQYDLAGRTVRKTFKLTDFDRSLLNLDFFGHDAWDQNGRFYVGAFGRQATNRPRAKLLAIDPLRLIAAVERRGG